MKHAAADTLKYFADLFAAHHVRWSVCGALAANAYRLQVRTTTDLDLLIELDEPTYNQVTAALLHDGWDIRPAGGERLAFPDIARLRHPNRFPVDLLLAKTPYQHTALQRVRSLDRLMLGITVPYLAPEDVVVHKLLAYRFRDRDDLESVFRAGVALDEEYIQHWCEEWDIVDRWQELLRSR